MSGGRHRTTTARDARDVRAIPRELRLAGDGVVLREWTEDDLPVMVELFDDPEIAYRTPLASPFDLDAAREYLAVIRRTRAEGRRIQLAITADGGRARGEVVLNLTAGTIGYVLGTAHRGQGLAVRAVRVLTDHAHRALVVASLCAQIEPDNRASTAVAEAAGYRLTARAPERAEDKGRSFALLTWVHECPGRSLPAG